MVATVNNGVIPLRMFNPHSKPQRIYKGSTIGQLYPLSGTTEKNEKEQQCYYDCQFLSPPENSEDTVSKDVWSKSLKELENIFRIDNVNIFTAEKNQVYDILVRHSKVISKGKHDLGEMRNVKHTIDTEGSRPIRVPYRRLPHRQRKNIRTEIDAILMADVIEPSNSPWSDPVVMVQKKDGSLRFCFNYR